VVMTCVEGIHDARERGSCAWREIGLGHETDGVVWMGTSRSKLGHQADLAHGLWQQ
jgi:hypothetical protein